MRGQGRRGLATGTLVKSDHGCAGAIAGLGCPTRSASRAWRDGHEGTGEVPAGRFATSSGHAAGTGRRAVEHHLGHGKSLTRTTGPLVTSRAARGPAGGPAGLRRDGEGAEARAPGGRHGLGADAPNEKWVTDVTEFRIPAGRTCLSPIVGCLKEFYCHRHKDYGNKSTKGRRN